MGAFRGILSRIRQWMVAPILTELSACRIEQRTFNDELRPFVFALIELLKAPQTSKLDPDPTGHALSLMEQLRGAISAMNGVSRRTISFVSEPSELYGPIQRKLAQHDAFWQRINDQQSAIEARLRQALNAGTPHGGIERYSSHLSKGTHGLVGTQLDEQVRSIHAEMAAAIELVRTMSICVLGHQVSGNGVDFARLDAEMNETVRIAEEAMLSLLTASCVSHSTTSTTDGNIAVKGSEI